MGRSIVSFETLAGRCCRAERPVNKGDRINQTITKGMNRAGISGDSILSNIGSPGIPGVVQEVEMKSANSPLALSLTFVLLGGCASIVSKSEYPVSISSEPQGAEITIVNREGKTVHSDMTPTTVTLDARAGFFKGEDYTVTFEKEGHAPHTAQIVRGVDGWYIFGNILIGGLIGWLIVDPATGAMWTLKDLHVDLKSTTADWRETGVHVVTLDEVPEQLRSELVRIK